MRFARNQLQGNSPTFAFSANWSKRDKVSKTLIHFKSDAFAAVADAKAFSLVHLPINPRAPMGSESIAREDERNNCFSKINIETKQLQLAKSDSAAIVLVFKAGAFRY